jgi:hypothetical protein
MKPLHALAAGLMTLVLAVATPRAGAMGWPPSPDALMDLANDATRSMMLRRVLKDAQAGAADAPPPSAAVAAMRITLAPGSPGAGVARRLAAQYPPAQQDEAERTFDQLLLAFRDIETRFGIPHNDVAGALAGLLAASVMASQDIDFPDRHFKPLVAQVRAALRKDAQFTAASPQHKRAMYEELATLGMFMSATRMALKQRPDPATQQRLRDAGRRYLQTWLQADPDQVAIGARGLVVR